MEKFSWWYFYTIPLTYLVILLFLTMVSKTIARNLEIKQWGQFFDLLFVSIVPVLNLLAAIGMTTGMFKSFNWLKPRGWKW